MIPTPDPECGVCAGPTRIVGTARHRTTSAVVVRCTKCGRLDGRLLPGPDDPPAVHRFVRRKLNAMLGVRRRTRATTR